MSDQIQPLGSRVLIKVLAEESITKSGLFVPDAAKEKPQRGEVVAIGDDAEVIKVAAGDRVLFPKYTGTELRLDGDDYLLIDSADLLAILRQSPAGDSRREAPASVVAA